MSAQAFVAALAEAPLLTARGTSLSGAIDFAASLFDGNGYAGDRRVTDVSVDGPHTHGRPVTLARDAAVAQGIVIHGLPTLNDRRQSFPLADADRQGARSITPTTWAAILSKLIREIAAAPRRRKLVRAGQRLMATAGCTAWTISLAGSSVFPTASNANPTFTIVSLSLRFADHLIPA
jgi:Protein of unknown function (DUF1194)